MSPFSFFYYWHSYIFEIEAQSCCQREKYSKSHRSFVVHTLHNKLKEVKKPWAVFYVFRKDKKSLMRMGQFQGSSTNVLHSWLYFPSSCPWIIPLPLINRVIVLQVSISLGKDEINDIHHCSCCLMLLSSESIPKH